MWFEWLMVAVGLVLTVGTGFFVASEFALVNLDRNDLEGREQPRRRCRTAYVEDEAGSTVLYFTSTRLRQRASAPPTSIRAGLALTARSARRCWCRAKQPQR